MTEDITNNEVAPARRRRRPAPGVLSQRPGLRVALIAAAAIAAVLVVAVAIDLAMSAGRVHPGVRVGDVAVGSLTPEDARAKVSSEVSARITAPVTARFGDSSWEITAERTGAAVDATASVQRAMAVGRSGSIGTAIAQRFAAIFGGVAVAAKVDADPARLDAFLDEMSDAMAKPARDATIAITGTDVRLVPAVPGVGLDRDRARSDILAALLAKDRVVTLQTTVAAPEVSDADAAQALADARKLASGPVTIEYQGKTFNVAKEDVAGWIVFTTRPFDSPALELSATGSSSDATASGETSPSSGTWTRRILVAGFDAALVGRSIAPFVGTIGRPAVDAQFVAENGRVRIVPSRTGQGPDLESLSRELAGACVSGTARKATMKLSVTQPKLTTEQARAMGISDRISTYTTTFSPSAKQRVNNIHLLSDTLNNVLIPPGGVFSFNGTAGERTASKGYQEAPAIVNGKLVPQLGGGVCQVGTTIFNTVFFSGLPILERRNHSFFISHYPKGRDCTVSWGGPDFKFKNDTAGWILIRTAVSSSSLTVALYGTDPGYKVEYTTSAFTNIKPHPVKETKDPLLAVGARLIEDAGVDGADCTVVRTVYKGGQVVRTDTFVSHYKTKEEVVRVGTKVTSKPATGTPVPKP